MLMGLFVGLWIGFLAFGLGIYLFMAYCLKQMALKAGNDDDVGLWWIPFVNTLIPIRIAGRPDWWLLLLLIPGVNVIASLIIMIEAAQSLGKAAVWGVLAIFLPFIGLPYLAFSADDYPVLRERDDIVIRLDE